MTHPLISFTNAMEWFIVLSLIGVGLLMLVVEVIFIPGTSIAGIIGFGLILFGLTLSFRYFDSDTGWLVLGVTAITSGLIFYWTFRTKPWKHFALKSAIKSKVNEGELEVLKVGETGLTISALRPMGKAEFHGKMYEVTSLTNYVEHGVQVKIIKLSSNQIIVEPLN
jgi:membrane-bound ClpP family serine protease